MALSRHDCTWRYKGVPGDELPRAVAQLLRIPRDRLQVPLSLSLLFPSPSFFPSPPPPLIPVVTLRSRGLRTSYPTTNLHDESSAYLYPTLIRMPLLRMCASRGCGAYTRVANVAEVLERTRVIRLLFPVASCGIVHTEPRTYFRRCTRAVPVDAQRCRQTRKIWRSHYQTHSLDALRLVHNTIASSHNKSPIDASCPCLQKFESVCATCSCVMNVFIN